MNQNILQKDMLDYVFPKTADRGRYVWTIAFGPFVTLAMPLIVIGIFLDANAIRMLVGPIAHLEASVLWITSIVATVVFIFTWIKIIRVLRCQVTAGLPLFQIQDHTHIPAKPCIEWLRNSNMSNAMRISPLIGVGVAILPSIGAVVLGSGLVAIVAACLWLALGYVIGSSFAILIGSVRTAFRAIREDDLRDMTNDKVSLISALTELLSWWILAVPFAVSWSSGALIMAHRRHTQEANSKLRTDSEQSVAELKRKSLERKK